MICKRIFVVCALVLAMGACSDDDPGAIGAPQPSSTSGPATTDDPDRAADDDDQEEPSNGAGAAVPELTGEVLATATGADGDVPLRLELNAVRRQGETVSITFGVVNEGDEGKWQVAQFFSGPYREDIDTSSTLAGVSLIDTVNGRRYPVLFGEDGICACDSDLSGRFVGPGETGRFSAVTGAPPADVDAVDVQVPGFGTFSAVPLADG